MAPRKIALLTDSCADLSQQLAEENRIHIVPLRICCADGEYRDGVDITAADVYRRLRSGELPKTSLPVGEDINAIFDRLAAEGYDGVIAVMLSGGLADVPDGPLIETLRAHELQGGVQDPPGRGLAL